MDGGVVNEVVNNYSLQFHINYVGAAIGLALVIIGSGLGIGIIGKAAMTAISRQPKISGDIRSSMIIVSALIEGISLFAVIICMLLVMNNNPDANKVRLFCAGVCSGLVVFGASIGISLIGKSAMCGIAMQPESCADSKSSMIVVSALIEGVSLFGVIVCMLLAM